MYADFIGSAGSIFGLTKPLYPSNFLLLASLGNLTKNYYSVYGGAAAQYPIYGAGAGGIISAAAAAAAAFYLNFGEGTTGYTGGQSYGVQYPHHQLYQYSALNSVAAGYPHHYGAPISLATTPGMQSGGMNQAPGLEVAVGFSVGITTIIRRRGRSKGT